MDQISRLAEQSMTPFREKINCAVVSVAFAQSLPIMFHPVSSVHRANVSAINVYIHRAKIYNQESVGKGNLHLCLWLTATYSQHI